MNTTAEAIRTLESAQQHAATAAEMIENLIAAHDYQDVALLVAQAATRLLEATMLLMKSDDMGALATLESADDLLDAVYDIIEADLEED
jgi:uncharacterized membrane-anchored protein YhcB (DUF1043 family)